MPATNEEFIKKAFAAGLTEDQVRAAVAERNQLAAKSTQPTSPEKSVGGLLQNAGRNVGDILTGLANTPKAIWDFSQEEAKINPIGSDPLGGVKMLGRVGKMVGGGVLKDVADTLGISATNTPEQGIRINVDPQAAAQHAYDKPVDTLLNVVPFLSAGKTAKAAKGLDQADVLSDVKKALPVVEAKKVLSADEVLAQAGKTPKQIQRSAMAQLQDSEFTVPTRRADKIKPIETMKELQANGHTNVTDIEDWRNIANQTTGENGLITKITRNAIADLKDEVNLLSDTNGNKVLDATKQQLKISHDIPKEIRADIEMQVQSILDEAQGSLPDTYDPGKLFDAQRQLEKMAAAENGKSTYLTKNLAAEDRADVFRAAASEIRQVIETEAKTKGNTVSKYITPEVIEQAKAISPRIAEKLAAAAEKGSIADVRSIAAPYAKLNEMIKLTDANAMSSFAKTGRKFDTMVSDVLGSIGGAQGRIAGKGIELATQGKTGRKISEIVENIAESTKKAGGSANSIKNSTLSKVKALLSKLPKATQDNKNKAFILNQLSKTMR